jgi:hypothetical protein
MNTDGGSGWLHAEGPAREWDSADAAVTGATDHAVTLIILSSIRSLFRDT